ncbi:branched-chain amino acid ABC transporter permease/ATP-binding protein [Hamadaea sp. NPDC051192]|uniref:branched-chain amino acid ABC transporter permease/ATP-binding protein n=1 Tax=Hamadaea sp. NPDC051192 TaxID=3154940 RepID=UPI00343B7EB6
MIDAVLLGLFTGFTYGLLAVGLVLAYRSSRFINFAHGSVGVLAAAVFAGLVTDAGLPYWWAFPLALATGAAVSAGIEAGVVRRLRGRPAVIGMIATLGLSQFVLILALLVNRDGLAGSRFPQPPGLPSFTVSRTPIGPAFVAMALLTPVLLAALGLFLRRSRHGLAVRAAADDGEAAVLNAVPPGRMATLAWGIAGAVAAFSAVLVTPTQGTQSIETLGPDLLLRGLAGAVAGRMASLPIAFATCVGLGVAEQILLAEGAGRGAVALALAVFILVALLAQPVLGRRATAEPAWPVPPAPTGVRRFAVAAVGLFVAAALAYLVTNEVASVLTTIVGFALIGLSVFVVTGIGGELSLGQVAFAGIGAAVSLHLAAVTGDFVLAAAGGCAAAAAAAVLTGLPAVRLRGVALAATTLAFALATSAWVLRQEIFLGDGLEAARPQVASYPLVLAKDYYLFAVLMLALGLWIADNVRRSGLGRLVRAARDNEQAVRAFAVDPRVRRLQAYAIAGVLAGLGGVVIGHGQSLLTVNSFPPSAGIDVVALTVVGGIGRLSGPLLGSVLLVGVPGLVDLGIPGQAALTVGWLAVVLFLPSGLGGALAGLAQRFRLARPRRAEPAVRETAPASEAAPVSRAAPVAGAASVDAAAPVSLAGRGLAGVLLRGPAAVAAGGTVLDVRSVSRSFGGVHAVTGVDLTVGAGEVVGVIGPNGAGKTTLFEIVAGFTAAQTGTVRFAGRDVTAMSPQRRARLGLVRSFQDARLFPTLSVRETLLVAQERTTPSGLLAGVLGATGAERRKAARVADLLDLVGLAGIADQPVGALSTGTRRMVELTGLLALEPTLVLLDEPSSGVSQADGVALGALLRRVNAELGVALLVIEHDLPLLSTVAGRIVAMESGRVIADGVPAEILRHPAVVASYLGDDHAAVHRSGVSL